jgi:enterochelin esterase-like enzyme
VGLSAGGSGAAILVLDHPAEYSVIESWSGYFQPTDPTGATTLDVGTATENADASLHSLVSTLRTQFRRYPTFFAFYVGRRDPTFVPDNLALDRELSAASVAHVFELYNGGHNDALWQAQAPRWLALAIDHLSPGPPSRPETRKQGGDGNGTV